MQGNGRQQGWTGMDLELLPRRRIWLQLSPKAFSKKNLQHVSQNAAIRHPQE